MAQSMRFAELSEALRALSAAAFELGTVASAVASAASAVAEQISHLSSDEKSPPATEHVAADHMEFHKLLSHATALPRVCSSLHCTEDADADVEKDSEEAMSTPIWEPCEQSRGAILAEQVQPYSVTPCSERLHFRVVWDVKKAVDVQHNDGTPVSSVAGILADRLEIKEGWTVHCGPKDWELLLSVPQGQGSVDSMREDITRLVKDVVEAEFKSSRGHGGRNLLGCIRVREEEKVTDCTPLLEIEEPSVGEDQAMPLVSVAAPHELFSVKNTFVHVSEPSSPSKSMLMKRRMSAPVSMLIAASTWLSHA